MVQQSVPGSVQTSPQAGVVTINSSGDTSSSSDKLAGHSRIQMVKIPTIVLLCSILLVVIFVPAYVYWFYSKTLEYPFVVGLRVTQIRDSQSPAVRIEGLSGHSALSVKAISTEREGSSVIVLVHLFLARHGTSGSFAYDVVVPDSVSEIRFGNDKIVIWKRSRS